MSGTFHVTGRFLYDRCNEKVVLRGVNEMVVWTAGKDGAPEFAEIAKTGANSVRIVWTEEGTASELDTAAPAPAPPAEGAPAPPGASPQLNALAAQARAHYDRAVAAQKNGDWATYGEELRQLGQVLQKMSGR